MPAISDYSPSLALPFELDTAPLLSNLSIQASAGSGKTYTLEHIVCRLVESYGISIKQILLVTYTDKAAEELRQRIRMRLSERLRQLQHNSLPKQSIPAEKAHDNILQALSQYNEAHISTIHSFFRHCLERYALEAGLSLAANTRVAVEPQNSKAKFLREELLQQLQESDFDGEMRYCLEMLASSFAKSTSKGTAHARFQLKNLLELCGESKLEHFWQEHPRFRLYPGPEEIAHLEAIEAEFGQQDGQAYQAFCRLANSDWEAASLKNTDSSKNPKSLGNGYTVEQLVPFFQCLRQLAHGSREITVEELGEEPSSPFRQLLRLLLKRPVKEGRAAGKQNILVPYVDMLYGLLPQNIEQNSPKFLAKNQSLKVWSNYAVAEAVAEFLQAFAPCFGSLKSLQAHGPVWDNRPCSGQLEALFLSKFLYQLRTKITPQLHLSQTLYGIRSFSDMVEGLYQVIVLGKKGDKEQLLRLLRLQYRCVLVDEFQDTDPQQWQILHQIFGFGRKLGRGITGSAEGLQRSHNYIVVGDPKQSIYRFRGASEKLYQQVQLGCDQCYRLKYNYRSNAWVLGACNQVFQTMWPDRKLFEAAAPGGTEACYLLNPNGSSSGFSFLDCSEFSGSSVSVLEAAIEVICRQTVALLSQNYRILMGELQEPANGLAQQERCRPVRPSDIAILMAKNHDCANICHRLEALGIPVHHNEKRSVFCDVLARALHYFLLALCQPRQLDHSLRLFLSPLFGLPLQSAQYLLGYRKIQASTAFVEDSSEFTLEWIQQLLVWKEQVDQGLFLSVCEQLLGYGSFLYRELSVLGEQHASAELQKDVFSRLLRCRQYSETLGAGAGTEQMLVSSLQEQLWQDNRQSYHNLRQLIEILSVEQLNRALDNQGLCSFLAQQIQSLDDSVEEYLQRDSYEGQAVEIMTLHKAKGLEFPIVFVGMGFSDKKPEALILQSQLQNRMTQNSRGLQEKGVQAHSLAWELEYTVYLVPDKQAKYREQLAECAEMRRLFYVGLTRASSKIYWPYFPAVLRANGMKKPYAALLQESLLGPLAGLGNCFFYQDERGGAHREYLSDEQLQKQVRALVQEQPKYFSLESVAEQHIEPSAILQNIAPSAEKKNRSLIDSNILHRFPAVNSFSSLQQSLSAEWETKSVIAHESIALGVEANGLETAGQHLPIGDGLGRGQDREREGSGEKSLIAASEFTALIAANYNMEELCWHELLLSPGAALGNFLHDLLEHSNYQMIASSTVEHLQSSVDFYEQSSSLSRRYFPRNWLKQAFPAVCRIIWHTLHCDLSVALGSEKQKALQLCQLSPNQREHELEFMLAIPKDCLLTGDSFLLDSCSQITVHRGYLKGFIDLLFLHDGQLYLLDWKSNLSAQNLLLEQYSSLGEKTELLSILQRRLYAPEVLQELMHSHCYQMQYLIYLAVIYFYFKRLYGSEFDYNTQFGGCYYLFLRGMQHILCGRGSEEPNQNGIFYHKPEEVLLQNILCGLGLTFF